MKHYFSILKGEEKAKYLDADVKGLAKKVERIVEHCNLCEWGCGIDRRKERGFCGVPYESRVSAAFLHWGEEEFLIPSGTIFFTGCNFKCVYCQNWDISQYPDAGEIWKPRDIARWIESTRAININFVGGEPTPHLHNILKALTYCRRNIPLIWNSNMYMSKPVMNILNQIIDVFLADFRYGNDACALRLSKVPNYTNIITRNLKKAEGDIIIRVLVLPNHIECCVYPTLDWIARNRADAVVNLLSQYRPVFEAKRYPEIARRIKREEYEKVVCYTRDLGLNAITQPIF